MADMTLEEALAAATVDEELVMPVDEVLLINPETRTINVPDSEKLFGARQDMNAERKYFKCPRIVGDNIDLSEHRIFINYVPSKQDGTYDPKEDVQGYWCKDLAVEGDFVTFSWKLSENVTRNAGYIAFAVYAKTIDEYGNLQTKWHTTIAIGNVLDTLPDGEEWTTVYPDIVMQLLERMDEVEKIATPESMQGYVDDYFNRNPMMIDRELKDETKAAPADIVGKLSEDIATKASAIKEKASGETIVVTDSDEQEPLELAIDGKSEQNQYSGNQLLDITKQAENASGSIVYNDDGSCTISNPTGTSIVGFKQILTGLLPAGTYTLKVYEEHVYLQTVSGDYSKYIDKGNTLTFEYDGTSFLQLISGNINSNESKTYKFMLNSGSTALPFEPYCGGIPSPNPSYPQEIRNIGVYDEASGKYAVTVKTTGKNLSMVNSIYLVSSKSTGNKPCRMKKGEKYTISCVRSRVDAKFRLYIKDENEKDISFHDFVFDSNNVGKATVIPTQDVYYADLYFIKDTTTDAVLFSNIQIEYGTVATPYEPYKETTATVLLDEPLRKGDKAYWNGGSKIRVDRNRAVSVFDGSDDELLNGENIGNTTRITAYYSNSAIEVSKDANQISYCDKLCRKADYVGDYEHFYTSTTTVLFFINNDRISSYNNVREYLTSNPITVEYELATPITEEIDIDLGKLSMFYPTTILSNDCNANMEVEYVADTKNYIDKLKVKHESDITALKTAIVALGGTV